MINEKLNKDILDLINENNAAINNIKGKILWTNSNPTNDFASQNILLSSSDYDVLEVFYRSDISGGVGFSAKCLKGYGTQCVFNSNISTNMWVRRITRNSDTSFSATNCVKVNDNSTSNSQCVPLYIVGYKTGLFS